MSAMTDWREAARRIWGGDWIAPLADVLNVNRRSVERWNASAIAIPAGVEADIVRLGRLGSNPRAAAYGRVLRLLATGESVEDIENEIRDTRWALARYRADRGSYRSIAVLAPQAGEDGRTARV